MSLIKLIHRDERGAAVIEMAIVLPVLILFIWGIFQIGIMFQANAGMQHALGEGARLATIFPTPSDTAIQTRINDRVFGTSPGTFTVPAPTNSAGFKTLSVTYSQPTNFLFFPGPTISITKTKKVYVAPAA